MVPAPRHPATGCLAQSVLRHLRLANNKFEEEVYGLQCTSAEERLCRQSRPGEGSDHARQRALACQQQGFSMVVQGIVMHWSTFAQEEKRKVLFLVRGEMHHADNKQQLATSKVCKRKPSTRCQLPINKHLGFPCGPFLDWDG